MFVFFHSIVKREEDCDMAAIFDTYDLNKLDINRITRYLDKHTSENKSIAGISFGDMDDNYMSDMNEIDAI